MNSPDYQAVPLTLSLQEIKDAEVNPEFGYFPIVMAAFVGMGVVMYEGLQVGWGTCDIELPGNTAVAADLGFWISCLQRSFRVNKLFSGCRFSGGLQQLPYAVLHNLAPAAQLLD